MNKKSSQRQTGFTLIELLVVIAIIALLMGILMPVLSKVRDIAKNVICVQRQGQWGLIFTMYLNDNNHQFFIAAMDGDRETNRWMQATESYCKDNKIRMCPKAATITEDSLGTGSTFLAWNACATGVCKISGIGSYGINRWVYDPPTNYSTIPHSNYYPADNYFGSSNFKTQDQIPLLLDCVWMEAGPSDSDIPADEWDFVPAHLGRGQGEITRFTINRHNGFVNGVFMDMSGRKIGLKELWSLKWNRNFNTHNEQISSGHWPEWMEKFEH
jgi:prepilin-type N-terminal cleavage/methylation domain-containing protein